MKMEPRAVPRGLARARLGPQSLRGPRGPAAVPGPRRGPRGPREHGPARTARPALRLLCGWNLARSRTVPAPVRSRTTSRQASDLSRAARTAQAPCARAAPRLPCEWSSGTGQSERLGRRLRAAQAGTAWQADRLSVVQSAPGGARRVGARSCEAVPITCS